MLEGGYRVGPWELFVRASAALLLPADRTLSGDALIGLARRL